jgi:hypothetical protein
MLKNPRQWNTQLEAKELNMLGNLTILPGKVNIEVSNKPFLDKFTIYKENKDGKGARFTNTANLQENQQWTEKEFRARQNWVLTKLDKLYKECEGRSHVGQMASISMSSMRRVI